MNKLNKKLLVILGIQALLAAITWSALHTEPTVTRKAKLFDFNAEDITSIRITAMQAEEIQSPIGLQREGENWVISTAEGFKATNESIEKIVQMLAEIKIDSPIATTKASHRKLSVDNDAFDRKIELTAKGKTHTFYMGRGGSASATVRQKGSDEVFDAAGISVWEIHSKAVNYIQPSYLDTSVEDLTSVTVVNEKGTMRFARQGSEWTIPGLTPAEVPADGTAPALDGEPSAAKVPDGVAIKGFVRKLAKVNITEPVGKTNKPEYGLDKATIVTLSGTKDGKPITATYKIGAKDDNSRFIKSDENDYIIKGSNYTFEPATQNTVDDFLKDPSEEKEPAAPVGPPGGMNMDQIPPELLQQLQQQQMMQMQGR